MRESSVDKAAPSQGKGLKSSMRGARQAASPIERRGFLLSGAALVAAGSMAGVVATIRDAAAAVSGRPDEEIARDEAFWVPVQQAYNVDPRFIMLNAGGSNPCPRPVHEMRQRLTDHINASPNINTYGPDVQQTIRFVRSRVAQHLGADPSEVALTRNTTEGLNIFIASLDLKPGDEILCSEEEYHVTQAALRLRERRDGVRVVRVGWSTPARSKQEIINAFRSGFSERTKAVVMCQIQHVGGQIMPVREVCAEAKKRGALTCVDGALGFGHVVTNVREMDCDYYASSLHKYLSAPLGTGVFYARQNLIASTWPLFGLEEQHQDSMMKFEAVGTRLMADVAAIAAALDFYEAVGPARKQARLHHLKRYWMDQLRDEPKLRFSVSPSAEHSCASAIVALDGIDGRTLNKHLAEKHRVWCYGPVKAGPYEGVYVAPNLFTRLSDLDTFVAAVRETARKGIS